MAKKKTAEAAAETVVTETAAPTALAPAAPAAPKHKLFNLKQADAIRAHRPGTKRAKVVEMIKRDGGATFEEIMTAIGWDAKTAYEGVRLVNQYLGYGMTTDADTGKITGSGDIPPMLEKQVAPVKEPKAPKEPKPKKLSKKAQAEADAAAAAAAATSDVPAEAETVQVEDGVEVGQTEEEPAAPDEVAEAAE